MENLSSECLEFAGKLWNYRRKNAQEITRDRLGVDESIFRASLTHLRKCCLSLAAEADNMLKDLANFDRVNIGFSLTMRPGVIGKGPILRYSLPNEKTAELRLKAETNCI
jgi:hypothetical protein